MINANELKIGNWYKGASRGEYEQVCAKTIYDLEQKKMNCIPIPLTPEILEKCGFVKSLLGDSICFTKPFKRPKSIMAKHEIVLLDFHETPYKESKGIYALAIREYDRDIQFAITYTKYLHHLQNVWFDLTGKELEFKP